jgi:hypothetical protein
MVVWDQELDSGAALQLGTLLKETASETWTVTGNVHLLKSTKSPRTLRDMLANRAADVHVLTLDVTLRDFATNGAGHDEARWLATRL